MRRTTVPALPLAVLTALALTACAGASTGSPAAGPSATATGAASSHSSPSDQNTPSAQNPPSAQAGAHNAADVAFVTGMIPHHRSALDMARMAVDRAQSPAVQALATRVVAAQGPEITTMTGWLTAWGRPVPTGATMAPMAGMDMGGDAGMPDSAGLDSLAGATGSTFDRRWLEMMSTHHRGAITMSNTELAQGADPAAQQLARSIITGQTAEIDQMRQLLTTIPG